ncbi:1760_t:CDS:2 [Rhizophagus irregularis]|nr:1760_t:CDS:2 [Rhizophagus irregularis]
MEKYITEFLFEDSYENSTTPALHRSICDDPEQSDLSDQFDVAEETKFANLDKLKFNITPCHENAIYISRPLDSIGVYY